MATRKTKTLTHISDYLNGEAKRLMADGYSEWISKNTGNPSASYSDALSKASTAYALSLRDYGAGSENLADRGLSKSGYSDYLNSSMKSSYAGAIKDAQKALGKSKAEGALGYEKYINQLSEKRDSLIKSIYNELTSNKVTDINYAYEQGLSKGLTDSEARELAKSATSKTRTSLFRTAVSAIISKTLTKEQATVYATSLGLPENDVTELGMIAHIINQMPASYSKYSGAYINYLKELRNTQK